MYKQNKIPTTSIKINESYVGETIEQKIQRITNNKEPISDGAPLVYTERNEGIRPEYDIRTDRWEIALDAMDTVSKAHKANRENKPTIGEKAKEGMKKEEETSVNTNDSDKK